MRASIIIRTKNEEKWIGSCLRSIFDQTHQDFEVILVDNQSTDKTVSKAQAFDIKLLEIEKFLPGKAINLGVRHSSGDVIVCLSGHCIPVHPTWLENLLKNFEDPNVAGVYGRQEPMSFSSDFDKRDLLIVFGLDKKIQKKDPFFHNANSAVRREVWDQIPFDERVTNIEDRVWAKQVLQQSNYHLVYEPEASVFHYHGIHQDMDLQRCKNVVRVLESMDNEHTLRKATLDANALNIVALIPIKGEPKCCGDKPLMEYTIEHAKRSQFINRVIVATDSHRTAEVAEQARVEVPFFRPNELSLEHVDLSTVLQYSLEQLENRQIFPDLLVLMEETYPFRPPGFIDTLITKLVNEGLDSVVPVKPEYRSTWLQENGEATMHGPGFMPRQWKDECVYISLLGLGCVTHPQLIRQGTIVGENAGILEITESYSDMEVREKTSLAYAHQILEAWWKDHYQ